MDFSEIKELYKKSRDIQREKIIDYLINEGYKVTGKEKGKKSKGGKGKINYTSGKTISPYDLSNWMYIEFQHKGYNYLLSLQSFDQDPKTKNIHVLYDRLGIYKYEKYNPNDAIHKMYTTNIDLPINTEKLILLKEIIEKL